MRWTRWTAATLWAAASFSAFSQLACTTQPQPAAPAGMTAEQRLDRGRYLVAVIGCGDCHTPGTFYGAPDTTRVLSGSDLGWAGPWGVVHAANLTPDPETGLGNWSEQQIATALRTGNRPDGRQLAPIMPWMDFSHMRVEDALAVATFLKSLPPVKHAALPLASPGAKASGALVVFPPPPAWDAMHLPPPPAATKP